MTLAFATQPTVTVAVCTFRRDHLEHTLRSLADLQLPDGHRLAAVVADNDTTPSARALVEKTIPDLPFEVRYVHAPASNISVARNACLDHAEGRHLAFLDDDEIVSAEWLGELLAEADASGADAVLGPVRSVYAPDAPDWMRRGDFHSTMPVFVNGRILTGYTCNVLLDRRSEAAGDLRFDPALGRSGGEDTAFFHALTARGGCISFAPGAEVTEAVPQDRATMAWLVRRRFRMGQTHGQILAEGRRVTTRLRMAAVAAAKLVACNALVLRHVADPVMRRRSLLRAMLHAGAIGGAFGMRSTSLYGGSASNGADARNGNRHAA